MATIANSNNSPPAKTTVVPNPVSHLNPIDNPQSWDYITLGGINSPGLAKVGDVKRAYDYDVKKGKGSVGATVTFVQKPPVKFSIVFYLWERNHFTEWDTFRENLKYDPTKKAVSALEIYHPSLADVDIHSVVTVSLGGIKHEGNAMYSIAVEFLEYFPPSPKSAVSTPSGSQQYVDYKGPGKAPPDTTAAADAAAKAAIDAMKKAYA